MQYLICGVLGWVLGFAPEHVVSKWEKRVEWEVEEPAGVDEVFAQKYTYLKAGSQSYAFLSEDEKYVVKFFRMKHFVPTWKDWFRPKRRAKKERNLEEVFGAYRLGFEEMKEDGALVYVHLNPTERLRKKLEVRDREGKVMWIDLDSTAFVVQEKAELVFDYLQRCGYADEEVEKVVALVRRRGEKGISDHDRGVSNNFGFVRGRAVQIDMGRIYKGDVREGEETRVQERIRKQLRDVYEK